VDFIKVNCADHSAFCRSRKIKHFPTIEIYIPPPRADASESEKLKFRLLKGPANYAVSPFRSDFSYTGMKGALQEIGLVPGVDPFSETKQKLQNEFEEAYYQQMGISKIKEQ
jgi:hypothetical protein